MSDQIVFGARIFLTDKDNPVTPDSTIGLYNVNTSNSEFRWVQNIVFSSSWAASGVLVPGGISNITESADLSVGGNVVQFSNVNLTINNTKQFWKELDSRGITLQGKLVEIFFYKNSVPSVIWKGVVGNTSWDVKVFHIPCIAQNETMKANILIEKYVQSDNKNITVPAIFGHWIDTPAPFKRVKNDKTFLTATMLMSPFDINTAGYIDKSTYLDQNAVVFPHVYGTSVVSDATTSFGLYTGSRHIGSPTPYFQYYNSAMTLYFDNRYITTVLGSGEGQVKKIIKAWAGGSTALGLYNISTNDHFFGDEQPFGNSSADEANNTWSKIFDLDNQYQGDNWPCSGHLNSEGNAISTDNGFSLYTYSSEDATDTTTSVKKEPVVKQLQGYKNIPQYSFEQKLTYTDGRALTILPSQTTEDENTLVGFSIIPFKQVQASRGIRDDYSGAFPSLDGCLGDSGEVIGDGADWEIINTGELTFPVPAITGVFYKTTGLDYSDFPKIFSSYNTNVADISDRYLSTGSEIVFSYDNESRYTPPTLDLYPLIVYELDLPDLPDNFSFSDMYILLYCYGVQEYSSDSGQVSNNSNNISVSVAKKIGRSFVNCFSDFGNASSLNMITDNMPDFYLQDRINYNRTFGIPFDHEILNNDFTGYQKFKVEGISNVEEYRTLGKCYVGSRIETYVSAWEHVHSLTFSFFIKEAAVCFSKKISIEETIYANFSGRIYNNTLEDRVPSDGVITSPINLLEHFCRLQNWSAYGGEQPIDGWGKQYCSGAKIKVGTYKGYSDISSPAFFPAETINIIDGGQGHFIKSEGAVIYLKDVAGTINFYPMTLSGMQSGVACNLVSGLFDIKDGSFDNTGIDVNQYVVDTDDNLFDYTMYAGAGARVLTEYSDGWTNNLKRSICKNFFLVSYIDNDGLECVKPLNFVSYSKTYPEVTYRDVIANSKITVDDPDLSDIFVEPFIKFDYDHGLKNFKKIIAVKNVAATCYDPTNPDYNGFLDTDVASNELFTEQRKEAIWNTCHSLWVKYPVFNEPPVEMVEQPWGTWFHDQADPLEATWKLEHWVNSMGKKTIDFDLHFNFYSQGSYARDWHPGQRIKVNFPHETDSRQVQAIVTEKMIKPYDPYTISIKAILI